jgi:diguanylate cyclase (GGDEF)-like protein/PAS domain S-box-containing protein
MKSNNSGDRPVSKQLADHLALAQNPRHFQAIIESSDDAIISKTLDGIVISWNQSAEHIFGYSEAEMLGQSMSVLFPQDRMDEESMLLEKIISGEKVDHIKTIRLHKDGSKVYVSVTISPIYNDLGVVIGASKIARDLTRQVKLEAKSSQLNNYVHHLAAIVESSDDAIISKTAEGIVTSWNKAAEKIFGYSAEEMIGSSLCRLFPDNWEQEESMIMDKLKKGEKIEHFRTVRVDKNGFKIHVSVTISPIFNEFGVFIGASKIARDITNAMNSEKLILDQANYDSLTGLANRRLMFDRLTQEIAKSLGTQSAIALMFIDLDHFKEVNDTVGHDAGDQLLILAGQRFKSLMRHTDTVSRFGGDEFVIMMPDLTALKYVEKIAAKLVVELQQPFLINGGELLISISLGIAVYPQDGNTVDELLKHADLAMYTAKKSGRNQMKFFNAQMANSIDE